MKLLVRVLVLLVLLSGAFYLGLQVGAPVRVANETPSAGSEAPPQHQQVYTCSMHPQIRLNKPGKCPICEMPLVPASSVEASQDTTPTLELSEQALAMASVETTVVERRHLTRDLRAVGKVQYDETSLATVTARVDGYVEKLFVNITGVDVKAGDHLVEIYSPDLLVAQQELLIALQNGSSNPLVESTKARLRNWGLTEKQIDELVNARKITDRVTLFSPITGTVIEKMIVEQSAFKAGDVLYRIANLDTVWVYLDIYEFDLPLVRYGQRVELTSEAYPAQVFPGMVTFVEPVLTEETRTVRVRVHIPNERHILKPGMYVSAVIKVDLGPDGKAAPTGVEGKYTCPMHPLVIRDEPGSCPLCQMPLELIPLDQPQATALNVGKAPPAAPGIRYACPMKCEGDKTYDKPGNCPICQMKLVSVTPPPSADEPALRGLLAVPVSAILDSGTRQLVYVEKMRGMFEPREVKLGPRCGDYYPVLSGLKEGERVVVRGGFLIDSQFQITGHPSLFYPGGVHATMGHHHGANEQALSTPAPAEKLARSTPATISSQHHH